MLSGHFLVESVTTLDSNLQVISSRGVARTSFYKFRLLFQLRLDECVSNPKHIEVDPHFKLAIECFPFLGVPSRYPLQFPLMISFHREVMYFLFEQAHSLFSTIPNASSKISHLSQVNQHAFLNHFNWCYYSCWYYCWYYCSLANLMNLT